VSSEFATPPLIALPADLMFAARIRDAATQANVPVHMARSVSQVLELIESATPAVIVDLDARSGDPVALIAQVKRDHPGVRVLAFVSHVREEAIAGARAAGADQVLARSAFVKRLPELVRRYGGNTD